MAEAGVLLDQDQLHCAICLDLLKDPVTISCGHSYCMGCIKAYWDHYDHNGVYSCPHCRETYAQRPILRKNTMLAEVVEKLKKTGLQAAPPAHCYAGPGDLGHKRHKLTDASGNLQEKICPHHDKLLEIYCRTDEQCICYLCTMDEHRGHETVSAATEKAEKQILMCMIQSEFQQGIQEREEGLQDLRQAVQSLKRSAQAAVEDSKRLFAELIHSIERRRSEVIALIRDQEKAAVSRAEGLLEQLEQEIAEFRRIDTELEQLSHTEDHIYFLQNCPSLCAHPGPGDIPTFVPQVSFEAAVKSVSELKEQLKDVCKRGFLKITESVKEADVIQIPKPTVREEFLQYYCHLTLDPNTAYSQLSLSEGNKEVTRVKESQSYPDHPARFDYWEQVLCREGLSGRHYWEVEWSGKGDVYIAVSYEGIMRNGWGHNALLGYNDKSWSLWCTPSKCYFYHNKIYITLPVAPSSRIGVYLDHRAGTLSFYSVSDTMALLHRVQTTFTQPLYPGFYANTAGSTIKLCTVGSH